MFRLRRIRIDRAEFRKFRKQWQVLMWKAVLMRLHSPVISVLEVAVAVVFSLQIQLMFEPRALQTQDLDLHGRDDILAKLPLDVRCSYAPRSAFVDELMSEVSRVLRANIQAANSEIELVRARLARNDTSKVLWAIFNVDGPAARPMTLNYKIRSSEIGENRMIMMHEEAPAQKDPYMVSGFMALQLAIERSFVEMRKNPALPEVADNLTIGRFPFYKVDFLILPSVIRPNTSVIYYMMVIAFLLLPIATLRMVLHDKETGFTGLMRLTNMSFAMLYIGWLNYLMITALPVTIVCTILLHPVFSATSALIVALFVMMYNVLSALFMLAVSTLFNHSTKALLTSILSWLLLTHITVVLDQVLVKASVMWRIGSLILPHSGLLYGLVTFTSRANLDDYADDDDARSVLRTMKPRYHKDSVASHLWPRWLSDLITLRDVHDILHAKNNISVGAILLAWCLHIVFWYLITIYLSNVHPGKFGSAKPWYYLCKKFIHDNDEQATIRGSTNWSAVEHTPSYIKPSIRLRCVTKEFGGLRETITAVDSVTLDFYREELSVILGHNGAGKSCLLKMITGMYKPTHGRILFEGRDREGSKGIESHAEPIGYCPQENILVNYMTTMQHLYMLAMVIVAALPGQMKGMSYKDAHRESLKLLKELNLESVKHLKMKACSFATQRRICLAMALVGDTKILVLDEPTHGFDLEHSRQMWDLLSSIKRKKTILMATNSMETADLLADRIAIIANGRIECYGSKMYLNRRYGIGYVLSLLVQEGTDVERLRAEVQGFSAEPVALCSTMGLVVRLDVPRSSRFTGLLQHLESNKEELGIVSVTLEAASIEGQFLKIGLSSQFKERSVHLSGSKCELVMHQRRQHLLQIPKTWERLSGRALRRQQFLAMFCKKFLHLTSSWRMYVFSTSLAIVTLIFTTMIGELSSFTFFDKAENVMNLTKYADNNLRVLYWAAADSTARNFLTTLCTTGQSYSERPNYHISGNITAADHMVHPDLHSIEFRDRYVMSVDVHSSGHIRLMYSSTAVHSGPVALNLLYNALLRYHSGSDDCWIRLTSQPVVSPGQWQHLLVHPRSVRNWENAVIVMTLFLLLPSVDMGTREKSSLSKTLQTNVAGVSTLTYWIPTYIVDYLLYALNVILFGILISVAYRSILQSSASEFAQMLLIFLCYGACAIPLGYCAQLFTKRLENVYLIVVIVNVAVVILLNGSVVFPMLYRALSSRGKYVLEILAHSFPPYVLACALSNYIMLNLYNRQCSHFNVCDTEFHIEDPCCLTCRGSNGCYEQLNAMLIKESGAEYYHSVTDDIFLMVSQSLVLLVLLEVFEQRNRRKWYGNLAPSTRNDTERSEEVTENIRVEEDTGNDGTKSRSPRVVLAVENLRKEYARKVAVARINFNVYNQECFGLLGLNGAGKSTIYRTLIGQTRMSAGRAVMYGQEFAKDQEMFIGMIGYCPQLNGLSDFMTGRQYLQLYAALRGIPYKHINDEVNKWLDILDMLDFENLRIAKCPWGIQRKISILQSLIGDSPMVFMDEPSAGIDVMSRHALCEILRHVRKTGRTVLITTHSMREAEAMCSRVGILVDGRFTVVGSCEQLKARYGRDFIMIVKVIPGFQLENLERIKRIIAESFPETRFADSHLGVLKYELESTISYSYVFDKLEKLRQRYMWITDFSITQPSMDEVFLSLMRKQEVTISEELTLLERLRLLIARVIRRA